ncbi:MAG: hypothetical protein ACKODC_05975 [Limnohabitans sp.]
MSHQNKQVAALRLGRPLAGMGVGGWVLACSALLWPAAAAVGEGSAGAPVQSAASRPISLNFQDVPLRQLLKVFADFTGLNLVASDSVSGQVSVRLQNVPWPQALDIVLRSKGHAFRQEGSVLWVAPEEEWTQRERKRLEIRAAMEAAQPPGDSGTAPAVCPRSRGGAAPAGRRCGQPLVGSAWLGTR